ncbi:MAG: aspartate aminotransferase family protein [Pirellulaceae bacterium]
MQRSFDGGPSQSRSSSLRSAVEHKVVDMEALLEYAFEASKDYVRGLDERSVMPPESDISALSSLRESLPVGPSDPGTTLKTLKNTVAPATVTTTGGRFFGFVVGGALPVTVAASWMASTWDQNAGSWILAPGAIELESIAAEWMLDILDLPRDAAVGFVTGSTMGTFSAIAAARSALLNKIGYDVKARGLTDAPRLRIVMSDEVHPTNVAALGYAGIGTDQIERVPTDEQGRLLVDEMPDLDEKTIVILQAGNINSGAFDPFEQVCHLASQAGAWVHVDGAFGLWARASESKRHLTTGIELADSWSVDGHKWLNLPQDSAVYMCRDHEAVADVFATHATYLMRDERRQPSNFVPELSRRARGVEFWAALKTLGRSGVNELVDRCCRHARRLAEGLSELGFEVLNDVVLNQVVFSSESDERNQIILDYIQNSGKIWLGPTTWKSRSAMRFSISSWATTEKDVQTAIEVLSEASQNSS